MGDGCREAWGQATLTDSIGFSSGGGACETGIAASAPGKPGGPWQLPLNSRPALSRHDLEGRRKPETYRRDALDALEARRWLDRTRERRDDRLALQATLREVSTLPRVQACGLYRVPSHAGVSVWNRRHRQTGENVAHVSSVMRCANVWACPICGPRIRSYRAADLDTAAGRWLEMGGGIALLTLTVPHHGGSQGGELKPMLRRLRTALGAALAGRGWKDLRQAHGVAHWVKAWDVTHGPNGWHPHVHALLFTLAPLDDAAVAELRQALARRWTDAVWAQGFDAPHDIHGVHLERARERSDAARYVCQVIGETESDAAPWSVAEETARADLKQSRHQGHRTPWQILDDFQRDGEFRDLVLWRDYERATKGVHSIRWSKGLRKVLALEQEISDQDAASQGPAPDPNLSEPMLVTVLRAEEWSLIRRQRGGVSQLLTLAEGGGAEAVAAWLRTLEAAADYTTRFHDLDPGELPT